MIKDSLVKDAKINYNTEAMKQKDKLIKHLSLRVNQFEEHVKRMIEREHKTRERMEILDRIDWEKLRGQDIRKSRRQ